MPAIKETPVEVESNVIPEPVAKEVPKCGIPEEEKKVVETSDALKTEPAKEQDAVVTPLETKKDANGAEEVAAEGANGKEVVGEKKESERIEESTAKVVDAEKTKNGASTENGKKSETSEAPPKADSENLESDKVETTVSASEVDGKKSDKKSEATEAVPEVDSAKAESGKTQEASEAVPKVDSDKTEDIKKSEASEAAPKVDSTEAEEAKTQEEASEAVPVVDNEKAEDDKKSEATEAAPVVESEKAEHDKKLEATEATPKVDSDKTEDVKKSEATEAAPKVVTEPEVEVAEPDLPPPPVETDKVEESSADEKMETDVTSSDQAKVAEEVKMDDDSAVDSTSEPAPSGAGSSSSVEPTPDVLKQIENLKKQGLAQYVQREFCAAADSFGKLLELQAPLYGEMSEKLGETYFLYGSAMYEFGKSENTVLGEKVKEKDDEDDENEDEEEKMEEGGEEDEKKEESEAEPATEKPAKVDHEPDNEKPADETIPGEDQEDEDDAFRVAWEMLELAKATFHKGDNKKRLADTLMKLGEVGIETGNAEAISEMLQGLEVRKKAFPENHRIVPETHFNIGVAFAFFEKYDEAVEHFNQAKSCLEKRIEVLSKSEAKEDVAEIEEMKQILPDIEEKIKDTQESKADKEKIKATAKDDVPKEAPFPAKDAEPAKPVSDITHLVRRKRKVDDIADERAAKQSRQDEESAAKKAESETEDKAEGEPMEKTEGEMNDKTDGEAAKKMESEAAKKMESETAKKTESEEAKKTESEEAKKTEGKEVDKTEDEAAKKTEGEAVVNTDGDQAKKTEGEASDKTEDTDGNKSETEKMEE